MIALLKAAATRLLPADVLCRWRWYRRQRGGAWVHSRTFGWERRPDSTADIDIALCKLQPSLYGGGVDIEDYRAEDYRAGHANQA